MGIIIEKSFKQNKLRFFLALVGALATLFIYPLNNELYGILGFVINNSVLFMPLVMIGLGQSSIRFFQNNNQSINARTKYFNFLVRMLTLNSVILVVIFYFFKLFASSFSTNPDSEYDTYLMYSVPGAILFGANQFFVHYLSNYKKIVLPVLWQSLYRFGLPLSFVLIMYAAVSITYGIYIILLSLAIGLVLLFVQSIRERRDTSLTPLNDDGSGMDKSLFYKYYFWAFASSIGSMIAFKIDVFMISSMLDFKSNGDYLIAMFMTNLIAYPISSVIAISTPIISQAWKENKLQEIKNIYLKGSGNLLFVGAAILMSILVLFQVLPAFLPKWEALRYLQYIVVIIGLSKLFDMMSSVNGVIIQHSEWYRYNTYFMLLLTVFNVMFNYIFIDQFGILGAALATLISLTLFNMLKCIFLYLKLGVHPFTRRSILFFISSTVIFYVIIYFGNNFNFYLSVPFSSLLILCFLASWLFLTDFAVETKKLVMNFVRK